MSVENPENPASEPAPKLVNGEVNGISNGHSDRPKHKSSSSNHKSSSKDKHRDKDRDRKDHKSSKSHHSSSSSHRDKDKEHKSSSSSHKTSSKDKDRDKDKDKSKEYKSLSKDKDREKEREKDRTKDHKTSSKDKDRHSNSSKDKHRDKDRHKSSSKDKHREKDRHKEHKSSSKDKHHGSDRHKKEKEDLQTQPVNVEDFKIRNECQVNLERYKPEPIEDPLENSQASQGSSCDYNMSQFKTDEPNFDIKEEASESEEEALLNQHKKVINTDDEEEKPLSDRKKIKEENPCNENAPLNIRKKVKAQSDDEEIPLSARKKAKIESEDEEAPLAMRKKKSDKKKKKRAETDDENEYGDEKPKKKKPKKEKVKDTRANIKAEQPITPVKGGRKKKEEEEQEVWKWWEEEKRDGNAKWNYLEHKGPVFAPEYEPLPKNVEFEYDGKTIRLSKDAEEVAGFYAKMLESDYCEKKQFNENFFNDWRKVMSSSEKSLIKDFKKCNFKKMHAHFSAESEKNRNRSKEEKKALKEKNEEVMKEYGTCTIDGHKEKIGNFKIEPPGLFRGRGEHPKMGMLKRRVLPEDVIINCSKDSKWPKAPEGHRWKEVRHDNSVTWLASWVENVQGQVKYVMLNPSSKLKGEKDWQKYETARKLLKHIDKIRATYRDEWKSKEMRIRQRAVALYFIDKLALRAGNEKDEDQADTVGCCSLRVEHVELHREKEGKEYLVVFDFLGKDSIRYYNEVEVEKRVFKNLELFKENKKDGDDLFDRLNTSVLNEHLRELMEGLTAKVFRTFNASYTLQKQLEELTDPDMSVPEKLLAYNRANRAVAILCNHQRSVPKTHQKSMETLKEKIRLKREQVEDCEREFKDLKRGNPTLRDKKKKQLDRLKEQLKKLELQETDRDENKTIALGTSKLNYLDPRISVAWCKKFGVPIEKIFNKTQRDKFRWAIDMAGPEYVF